MIELHLTLKVPAKKFREISEALLMLAKDVRMEPECIEVGVYKNMSMPHVFCYEEVWKSEVALRKMIASNHFRQLSSLMELSSEMPDCQFRFINDVQGIEFASRASEKSIGVDF